MTYEEKSKKLREHLHSEEIEEFEKLLQGIFDDKSSEAVECLIRALEKDDDYHDEMYQILHAAEAYPMDVFLQGLLKVFNEPLGDPYWLGMLVLRVMNTPMCFAEMKSVVKDMTPEASESLKKVAMMASTQKPEFLSRTMELIKELNKN